MFLKTKGAILITTALLSVFLLSLLAIVIDIGYAYHEQNKLLFAIKTASIAGNELYTNYQKNNKSYVLSDEQIKQVDEHVRELLSLNVSEQFAQNADIKILNGKITITAKQKIGLFFARIININNLDLYISNKDLL